MKRLEGRKPRESRGLLEKPLWGHRRTERRRRCASFSTHPGLPPRPALPGQRCQAIHFPSLAPGTAWQKIRPRRRRVKLKAPRIPRTQCRPAEGSLGLWREARRVLQSRKMGAFWQLPSAKTLLPSPPPPAPHPVYKGNAPFSALPPPSSCADSPWAFHSHGSPPPVGLQPGPFLLRLPLPEATGHLLRTATQDSRVLHTLCVERGNAERAQIQTLPTPLSSNTTPLGLPGHPWRGPAIGRPGSTVIGTRNLP